MSYGTNSTRNFSPQWFFLLSVSGYSLYKMKKKIIRNVFLKMNILFWCHINTYIFFYSSGERWTKNFKGNELVKSVYGYDFYEDDFVKKSHILDVTLLKDCIKQCIKNPDCKRFTFVTSNMFCIPKDSGNIKSCSGAYFGYITSRRHL